MSVEKMREEFEAHVYSTPFYAYQPGDPLDIDDADGGYLDAHLHGAWLSWQASRAALVVELPPTITVEDAAEAVGLEDERAVTVAHMVNGAIAACGAFIKAAGVTVK